MSTVSGGSVFGASLMASIIRSEGPSEFIFRMQDELARGFIGRAALHPALMKLVLPGYNRTRLLGEAFDRLLLGGMSLADLPDRPALVLNTTVLNHGQVGRFTKDGFATWNLRTRERRLLPCKANVSLGLATAASAAFPFGLPPVVLKIGDLEGAEPEEHLFGHRALYLTDGGVLENLGVQTLMKSRTYGCQQIIVSDAEVREASWRPSLLGRLMSLGAYALTADTLERLLSIMNGKQNRSMRELAVERAQADAFATIIAADRSEDVVRALCAQRPIRLAMVRIDQSWRGFLRGISAVARVALAREVGCQLEHIPTVDSTADALDEWLTSVLPDERRILFEKARASYCEDQQEIANAVATSFSSLRRSQIDALEGHAYWQVYASAAVYGLQTGLG